MSTHNWSNLHCLFISHLFKCLDQEKVKYFVLRNYERLPELNTAKDIDIVIEPGKYVQVHSCLNTIMHHWSITYYTIHKFDRMRCWYIMDLEKHFSIHIDIIENEVYKGYEFFRFADLYAHVVKYKNFYILNPIYDTAMLLIQNIVAYKHLKDKYRETIRQNYAKYPKEIGSILINFFGNRTGLELIQKLDKSDFDSMQLDAYKYEKAAMCRILYRRPIYTIRNILRFLFEKFYQIMICPQERRKFVAVEAPDGTGKTTFIGALVNELSFFYNCGSERFQVHHFRPSIFPNLGAAGEKAGIMKQDKDFANPHRAKPANWISSLIRMIYYWCDYAIGIPILIRQESQYGKYTIFDRYIYDFLVDPHRSRINLPYWLRILFVKFAPAPRIVFILRASPSIIYSRKQELTMEEITRQLADFGKLKLISNNCWFINADKSPSEMTKEALRIIMERFMYKVQK